MHEKQDDFSFSQLFIPLTTKKIVFTIILIGLGVYANALFNSFVWDDKAYILSNTDIHSFSLDKIFGSSFFNKDGYYRPFPAFYFTILYAFFAKQAFFYHLSQIILHLVNTILVFRLFKHFFQKEIAFIVSLFFLVHPVMVESVAFIGATISPLFVFFGLCALQLLLRKNPLSTLGYIGVTACLFLSLLTKEGGVLFFIISLVFVFLFLRKSFVTLLIYESFMVPLYLFLRIVLGKVYLTGIEAILFGPGSTVSDGRFVPIMELTLFQRIGMIPSILWYYLKTFFYPAKLAIDQTWVITNLTIQTFYLPLLFALIFFALLIFLTWHLYKTKSKLFSPFVFFFIWFLIGIGMHLQLLPLDMTVADRWFYFPMIGILGMLCVLGEQFLNSKRKNTALIISLILLSIFSVRTVVRNANFADEITLYSHDRLVEDNYEIELNLGSAYGVVGELDKTLYHYKKSISLFPNEANFDNMALFSEWKGDLKQAKYYYIKALEARSFYLNPNKRLAFTYIHLSSVSLMLKDYEYAKKICLEGLKAYPNDHDLWLQLGESEYMLGNKEQASIAVKKAIRIKIDKKSQDILKQIEQDLPLEIK